MEYVSFVLKIDPSHKDEYVERHKNVDPELEAQFREVGIHRYHIFFCDGLLFAYMEVDNFEQAMSQLADHSANVKWQAYMSDLLQEWESGSKVKRIEEVYRFVGA